MNHKTIILHFMLILTELHYIMLYEIGISTELLSFKNNF